MSCRGCRTAGVHGAGFGVAGFGVAGFGGAGFGGAGLFCLGVVRGWFVGVRQGCLGAWWAGVGLGSAFLVAVWRCWVLECVVFVMG